MIDLDKLKLMYQFTKDLKLKDMEVLIQSAKPISYGKKEILIKEGVVKRDIFFLSEGLVRTYTTDASGKEITYSLIKENELVCSLSSIFCRKKSKFTFEVVEPIKGYEIDYNRVDYLVSKNPKLECNRKFALAKMMQSYCERIESFVLLTPVERYLSFIKKYPDINNRVPDKYIASILGVTPVSLSRIRKRIFEIV